ncbi:hypothetical protein HYU94_00555 [Candidatus Daviesbacteria bacterium]|nr:hypothetical protein [Candidatus Daviesbacteria bacterium]
MAERESTAPKQVPERKITFNWEDLLASKLPLIKAQTLKESLTGTDRTSRWSNLRRRYDPKRKHFVTKDQVDRALGIIK